MNQKQQGTRANRSNLETKNEEQNMNSSTGEAITQNLDESSTGKIEPNQDSSRGMGKAESNEFTLNEIATK